MSERTPDSDELATRRRGRHAADAAIAHAIAGGATHEEAARRAGVSVRTVSRRLRDERFCALLDDVKARTFAAVASELIAGAAEAVASLREILLGADTPATVRVSAARTLLGAALQYADATEVRDELRQIRQIVYPEPGETRL
jgi:hypothetical protein